MSIILPSQYNRKPPVGSVPDFTHPMMRGLVGWWPFLGGAGNEVFDYSKNNTTGVLTNMNNADWVSGQTRFGGHVLDFDGSDDFVELGTDLIGDSDLVVMSVWVNFKTLGKVVSFFGRGQDGSGVGWSILMHKDITDELEFHIVRTVPSTAGVVANSTVTVVANRWYHVVGIWEPTVGVKIYVDGILKDTTTDAGSVLRSSTVGTRIGGGIQDTSDRFLDGLIDDVRIYNRPLSPHEIWQLYTNPWAPFRTKRIFVDDVAVVTGIASRRLLVGHGI